MGCKVKELRFGLHKCRTPARTYFQGGNITGVRAYLFSKDKQSVHSIFVGFASCVPTVMASREQRFFTPS